MGLTAAALGCRAVLVDPIPRHVAFIRASIAANGWEGRVRVVHAAVGSERGKVQIQDAGMWSTVGEISAHRGEILSVASLPFDELLTDDELANLSFLKVRAVR